jgi:class 3 adenylate cyclase
MSGTQRVDGVSILFCDLVGSTALAEAIGEARNDELRRDLFDVLRVAFGWYGGREVKNTGDGLMAAFESSPEDTPWWRPPGSAPPRPVARCW